MRVNPYIYEMDALQDLSCAGDTVYQIVLGIVITSNRRILGSW